MKITKNPRLNLDAKSFQSLRRSVLKRDGWRCQSCGSRAGLEVHHIPKRSWDTIQKKNLITLCWECHRQIHSTNST
jgi:ATP-dependent DNA helicase RecQ